MIKVILPAGEIPITATVTKIGGTSKFSLSKIIRVFSECKVQCKTMKAEEGTIFLVDNRPDFSCIPTTKELIWLADEEDLIEWLEKDNK